MTGAIVNVDDIQVHRNDDGKADETLTDLVAHFVDPKTEEIWDAHRVITIADDQAALLQGMNHFERPDVHIFTVKGTRWPKGCNRLP